MLGGMTERWDIRWNDLNDRLIGFAEESDPDFVAAFLDGEDAVVEIRRSAPTNDEMAGRYTTLVDPAGFRGPSFHEVPVSAHDARAVARLVADAEDTLRAAGIRVWSIGSNGRAGDTRVVSYEDPGDRGVPQSLLDDLTRFPTGTVELRRVNGPTHRGV